MRNQQITKVAVMVLALSCIALSTWATPIPPTVTTSDGAYIDLGWVSNNSQGQNELLSQLNAQIVTYNVSHDPDLAEVTSPSQAATLPPSGTGDSITLTVYNDCYVIIHWGGQETHTYDAYYALSAGTYTFTLENGGGVSGYTIYSSSQVPIIPGAWLLGSGLVGIFGIRRKMKE